MAAQPTDALLGREDEVRAVVSQLATALATVVTVTGLPGVGKSALAAEAVRQVPQRGMWVDVATVRSALDVFAAICQSLGDHVAPTRDAVVCRLGSSDTLVVLDGCEYADAVIAAVEVLRERCPRVRLLATARSPLGVEGEHVIRLSPLAVPPAGIDDLDVIAGTSSVQLFLRRASHADSTFAPGPDDLRAIGELCRNLDGMPLAIVLAATRLGLMKPKPMADVAARLGARALVGIDLGHALQRAVDHLDDAPRRVLLALATFAGDATVEAVHAVVGGDELTDTIDALTTLVDLDLGRPDNERGRFSIMSSARNLLQEELLARPLGEWLRGRHARYFARRTRAERVGGATSTRPGPSSSGHVAEFQDRLEALDWLRAHGTPDEALRLAVDLTPGFLARGDQAGGRALLVESLALAAGAGDPRTNGEAHVAIVRFQWEGTGTLDVEGAAAHLQAARQLAEQSGDRGLLFLVLNAACEHYTLLGAFDEAERAVRSGLALCEGRGDDHARMNLLGWRAVVAHQSGRPEVAESVIWEAIQLALPLGDRRLTDRTCVIYWGLPERVRQHDAEVPSLTELIEMARREGDDRGEGWLLTIAMGNALDRDDIATAVDACRAAVALSRRTGNAPLARQVLGAAIRLAAHACRWDVAAFLEGVLFHDTVTLTARIPPHSLAALQDATRRAREVLGTSRHRTLVGRGHRQRPPDALAMCEELLDELAASTPTPLVDLTSDVDGIADAGGSTRSDAAALKRDGTLPHTLAVPASRADLTPRERDLLVLLAAGHTNKDIAAALHLAPATVRNQLHGLFAKLGFSRRAEAAAFAVRLGVVRDTNPI